MTLRSKNCSALQGAQTKRSASDPNSSSYVGDKLVQIENKINKHGVSGGGRGTSPLPISDGLLEDDDELAKIGGHLFGRLDRLRDTSYRTTGTFALLQKFVGEFQEKRAKVTDETVSAFMDASSEIAATTGKVQTVN
ncbi:uncharacterized protein BT62DRAFT_1074618 [Guyanagaster necrorhizus]|uniref:Uncharacterized protein n=1 Tax=Guyanagaster necrorhizus TaxID=856835 RepID=A0A9P7VV66_9AGAR|nr:uncharacterized protein BT62DRAFT_1074618 [Guyanagaster necrorhizus MCA 3950]KAG7448111.1 hypothetical protein BT62DRAFT_1074618 [Guyanagaster necrorhizus MCA 3950]